VYHPGLTEIGSTGIVISKDGRWKADWPLHFIRLAADKQVLEIDSKDSMLKALKMESEAANDWSESLTTERCHK
jgi:hypothetical protein